MAKKFHKKSEKCLPILRANTLSILITIPIVIILVLLYIKIHGKFEFFNSVELISENLVISIIIFIVGTYVHEIIHYLCFKGFGRNMHYSVFIKFNRKKLTPYVYIKDPVLVKTYKFSLIMPFLLLGVLPYLVGLTFGNNCLFIFGIFFILVAGGDLLILFLLIKTKNDKHVLDHPSKVGCYVGDMK